MIEQPPLRLGYREARVSPCQDCASAPCCSLLNLQTFRAVSLMDIDRALLALNFEGIELGLSRSFEFSIYYRKPCRHLDTATGKCTIYHQPQRPRLCAHYNPYACWYRPIYTRSLHRDYLRVDRRRMERLAEMLVFDADRNIVSAPKWHEILQAMVELDRSPPDPDPGPGPAGAEAAQAQVRLPQVPAEEPCASCAAHCCKVLTFPQERPRSAADLDVLRYALGFTDVTLGIADNGSWHLVVKTRCRHLAGDRCSIFGKPERPFFCQFYDAATCSFRAWFGAERPRRLLEVPVEQFDVLLGALTLDEQGQVTSVPPPQALQARLQAASR